MDASKPVIFEDYDVNESNTRKLVYRKKIVSESETLRIGQFKRRNTNFKIPSFG
jgi:hypothetical protein